MRVRRKSQREAGQGPTDPPPVYLDARVELATRFLSGEGLEIGALHAPLAVPPQARVRYVDRLAVEELRREYPELADEELVPVDVIDDGETLGTVPDGSQDFIVANHFLEHCEDPIGTIGVHLRKLKPGGILFYAVPDKRYTFDFRRPPTPLEHMVADHEDGPGHSRRGHYEEWTRLVGEEPTSEEQTVREARELEAASYSIHMHVWTQAEFLQLVLHCRQRFGEFDIEAAMRRSLELVVLLRKHGPLPDSPPATGAVGAPPRSSALGRVRSRLGSWRRIRRG
ncbi:MAG: methyltransferase domain-containing protein [Solirubrobacterales bacterium]